MTGTPPSAPGPGVVSPWIQMAIAVYLFAALAVGVPLLVAVTHEGEPPAEGSRDLVELVMPLQGAVAVAVLVATAWIVRRVGAARIGIRWWGLAGPGFWVVGAYAAAMLVWFPFTFFVYPSLLNAIGVEMQAQPHLMWFADSDSGPTFWILIATICLVGPAVEEIIFRGFLQTGLRRVIGVWPALLVVSALFGSIHGLDKALPLALMGAFFGILRERDDGLAAPVVAHCLHNSVTVLLTMQMPEVVQEAFGR